MNSSFPPGPSLQLISGASATAAPGTAALTPTLDAATAPHTPWGNVLAYGSALVMGSALLYGLYRWLSDEPAALSPARRLASNAANGRAYEQTVRGILEQRYPRAVVEPQVAVSMPDGSRKVIDLLVTQPNGWQIPHECKYVPEVRSAHVQQARDSYLGLVHSRGGRIAAPVLATPPSTDTSRAVTAGLRMLRTA